MDLSQRRTAWPFKVTRVRLSETETLSSPIFVNAKRY